MNKELFFVLIIMFTAKPFTEFYLGSVVPPNFLLFFTNYFLYTLYFLSLYKLSCIIYSILHTLYYIVYPILYCTFYCLYFFYFVTYRILHYENEIVEDTLPNNDQMRDTCPICYELKPTFALVCCGQTFCTQCKDSWFTRNLTCPFCRASQV